MFHGADSNLTLGSPGRRIFSPIQGRARTTFRGPIMRFTFILAAALAAGLAVAAPHAAMPQADTLESVLARAGEYVAGFGRQLAGIAAEEHYAQEAQVSSVSSGGVGGGMDTLGARRSTRAEQRR